MKLLRFLPLLVIVLLGCKQEKKEVSSKQPIHDVESKKNSEDEVLFSFVFVGCNRVDYQDRHNEQATNASSANVAVLKRVFNEVTTLKQKPELFFFLGDLVFGLKTDKSVDAELGAWVKQYNDTNFSGISGSGIELVAVPGNHEMLYYDESSGDEFPLAGTTEVWMRHMTPFLPKDRVHVEGKDSLINRATFAFKRFNTGFVVMNTDTYDAPSKEYPNGREGMIPTSWVLSKVAEFKNNPNIEHIFVLGHKPYYVNNVPRTDHTGLPEGPILWPEFNASHVEAMLSAHVHDYQRWQPGNEGTYQIIAGNGGSKGTAKFFGYSVIKVMKSGKVKLESHGFDVGNPYYTVDENSKTTIRDETELTWSKNENPYQ